MFGLYWSVSVAAVSYALNITADQYIYDLYIDGISYPVANFDSWANVGTISLNFRPRQISVYAYDTSGGSGLLASDSMGTKTDSSWKCTWQLYPDWMLVSPTIWSLLRSGYDFVYHLTFRISRMLAATDL